MPNNIKVYIGADHAGFKLKEKIKKFLDKKKISYTDLSPVFKEGDDYPDVAFKVGEKVAKSKDARGILICGSGAGMVIAANKVKGIRAAESYNIETAKLSRQHNDSNILALGAWELSPQLAENIISRWLNTKFSEKRRHKRRLAKIIRYEK